MKTVHVELPERTAAEITEMVRAGWFSSEDEAVRASVLDFVRRNLGYWPRALRSDGLAGLLPAPRRDLIERFQYQDIEWARAQNKRPN